MTFRTRIHGLNRPRFDAASFQTRKEAASNRGRFKAGADGTRDFTICRECQHMEDGWPSDVYPCPTICAITAHLGGDQ